MQECLKGILKNKTVLLVTHQVDFLQNVDTIIVSFFNYPYYSVDEHIVLVFCYVFACVVTHQVDFLQNVDTILVSFLNCPYLHNETV
jgi:ATPase subunit of ABC transporter with duplicated ATPase domains